MRKSLLLLSFLLLCLTVSASTVGEPARDTFYGRLTKEELPVYIAMDISSKLETSTQSFSEGTEVRLTETAAAAFEEVFEWDFYGNYSNNVMVRFTMNPFKSGNTTKNYYYRFSTEETYYTDKNDVKVYGYNDKTSTSKDFTNTSKEISTSYSVQITYIPQAAVPTNIKWHRKGSFAVKLKDGYPKDNKTYTATMTIAIEAE